MSTKTPFGSLSVTLFTIEHFSSMDILVGLRHVCNEARCKFFSSMTLPARTRNTLLFSASWWPQDKISSYTRKCTVSTFVVMSLLGWKNRKLAISLRKTLQNLITLNFESCSSLCTHHYLFRQVQNRPTIPETRLLSRKTVTWRAST